MALACVVTLAGCRQDMHDQPKYIPLRSSDFFPDGRSARAPVEGTVARGQLREDVHLYTGMIAGKPAETFPFPVTREVLDRGRERFNAICAPCHSRLGDGNGIIVLRGYRRPESFHTDRLRKAAVGYYFDVMTRGFGAMPDYAPQLTPQDRWAIAAYIRALQLSQAATLEDVPAEERRRLEQTRGEGMTPTPEAPAPAATPGGDSR